MSDTRILILGLPKFDQSNDVAMYTKTVKTPHGTLDSSQNAMQHLGSTSPQRQRLARSCKCGLVGSSV